MNNIKVKFNNKNETKISVIIPVFNCEKTIKYAVRSIQNQNMSDIEILLINDFSNDTTLRIIEDLNFNDSRIRIINNNKNMGTLYSRCIGVLKAKGKYIFALDNDDLFMDYDLFDIIFEEAEAGKYDIVGFKAVRGSSYNINVLNLVDDVFHDIPNNLILHQPELGIHSFTKNGNYVINDIHIWGKCINTQIYKKGVIALGKKRYSTFMSWAEDTSMVFVLFNIAKSFKFISKYGVFHLMSQKTACFTQPDDNNMFGEIFLLDIMFDFSNNDFKGKHLLVGKSLEIRNYYFFNLYNESNVKYLDYVLKKIINSKYLTREDKNIIRQNYREFNLTEY
jgi:glycosyltransferase involved in cell wall biosynthesis